jgi:hypothetical protein
MQIHVIKLGGTHNNYCALKVNISLLLLHHHQAQVLAATSPFNYSESLKTHFHLLLDPPACLCPFNIIETVKLYEVIMTV